MSASVSEAVCVSASVRERRARAELRVKKDNAGNAVNDDNDDPWDPHVDENFIHELCDIDDLPQTVATEIVRVFRPPIASTCRNLISMALTGQQIGKNAHETCVGVLFKVLKVLCQLA